MIRNATHPGWALGNDRFREEIEHLAQRRARPPAEGQVKDKR